MPIDKPKFTFRPYLPADEADCLDLFDSNTPQYFGPAERIIIDTSQHSQSFFARFGFQQTCFTPDYYAPGLHRVDMELELTDNLRRLLAE